MTNSTANQTETQSFYELERQKIEIFATEAEKRVIESKAKKAGVSINTYMRYAALGYPM
jgi:hypothetical protein